MWHEKTLCKPKYFSKNFVRKLLISSSFILKSSNSIQTLLYEHHIEFFLGSYTKYSSYPSVPSLRNFFRNILASDLVSTKSENKRFESNG